MKKEIFCRVWTKEGPKDLITKEEWLEFDEDKLHRLDGPAVEFVNGAKYWFVDGKHHRLDGHAVEFSDGSKFWFVDGKHHRLDGPAMEWANGLKFWCVNDNQLSTFEVKTWLEKNNIDLKTKEGQMAFKLRFS